LACGGDRGIVELWDMGVSSQDAHYLRAIDCESVDPCFAIVAVGEDEIACGCGNSIRMYNIVSDSVRLVIETAHADFVGNLYWNVENDVIVSIGGDYVVGLWDGKSGKSVGKLIGHEKSIYSVVGYGVNVVVTASPDRTVRFWDVRSRDCVRTIEVKGEGVVRVSVMEEGVLVGCELSERIRFWSK